MMLVTIVRVLLVNVAWIAIATQATVAAFRLPVDPDSPWRLQHFSNLITFGDSYTDESRLPWFVAHGGEAPPKGLILPESDQTASGGKVWPRFVVEATGRTVGGKWQPRLELYNYASAGASCSNEITPRHFDLIGKSYPSVLEYQVPAFKADADSERLDTDRPFYTVARDPSNSLYVLWIGVNDLGVFVDDGQTKGKTLNDYVNCNYAVIDELYAAGARRFVLMNTVPLQLSPMYSNSTLGLSRANKDMFGPFKSPDPKVVDAIAEKMQQLSTAVNEMFQSQTAVDVANRYPGAAWALFDVWSLFNDMYNDPNKYLNWYRSLMDCHAEPIHYGGRRFCANQNSKDDPGVFMWVDSLHPSERAQEAVAREFVKVMKGSSKYATYY